MTEATKAPRPRAKKVEAERPVVHDQVTAALYVGEFAMTVEQAKELMGYTEDEKEAKEKGCTEPLYFCPLLKRNIWCWNNRNNRPFYQANMEGLAQEHLMRRWRFNGEPVIIGKTGIVENGQHQMSSLWYADLLRVTEDNGNHWKEYWPGPVTMEKVVVFGIEEDDAIIDTMDTCKPRSLADVLYRSKHFRRAKQRDRKVQARMLDMSVRLLWQRTGAGIDAFAPRRTHSEALHFISRHPKLLSCVKHVWEEYQGGKKEDTAQRWRTNNQRLGAGYAAALLYLMGSGASDGEAYRAMQQPAEKKLKWGHWDRAQEFWTRFAANDPKLEPLFRCLGYLADPESGVGGTLREKVSLVALAWPLFLRDAPLNVKALDLEPYYTESDAGIRTMTTIPLFGGIDIGESRMSRPREDDEDTGDPARPDGPTLEDIERMKKETKDKKEAKRRKPQVEEDGEAE